MIPSNKFKYIYDVKAANFFMENGCICLGTGLHSRTKKVFFIFDYDKCQSVYEKWLSKCKEKNSH